MTEPRYPISLGPGTCNIGWDALDGVGGLGTFIALRGTFTSQGYAAGDVALMFAEVSARFSNGVPIFMGFSSPAFFHLSSSNEFPPSSTNALNQPVYLRVPLDPSSIELVEEYRQGGDFYLLITTHLVLVTARQLNQDSSSQAPISLCGSYPAYLHVKSIDWAAVLERWDRGVGIPIVVSLPELLAGGERSEIVRLLKEAWRAIADGRYEDAITRGRQSAEMLRNLSPADMPIPRKAKNRNIDQRYHQVIQELFNLGSAPLHKDGPTANYVPTRADAVALIASVAAIAQAVFKRIEQR